MANLLDLCAVSLPNGFTAGGLPTSLHNIDALLTPTTATPAIPIAEVDQTGTPAGFTRMANLLDLCAVSLPNGFTAGGLPTSLHIVGKSYDEATVLRIAWAYEQATRWHLRRPPEA